MKRTTAVWLGTAGLFLAIPSAALAQAHDFRGFTLGATLSEFRAAPLPDQDWQDRRAARSVACSTESRASAVAQSEEDEEIGTVTCVWMRGGPEAFRTEATPVLGKYVAFSHSLHFIAKPGDAEPRLFRMTFSANADAYSDIVDSLKAKFGEPALVAPSAVQNRMGATFNSDARLWENPMSSVVAIERAGRVDRMWLLYTLKDYETFYNERKAAQRAKRPSKL